MDVKAPKGTRDVKPDESYKWHHIEAAARELCAVNGFLEVRTPVIEHTELFARGVGDTSDIVQKEMYTFTDKGERSITLKPEGTAGVARMFIEHGLLNEAQPTKLYYLNCPVFRYENPQSGRLREHHQFGLELFGSKSPLADAECILLALNFFKALNIEELALNINSIGCPKCRPAYNDALREYLGGHTEQLCETCLTRLDKNPLRILDCKTKRCSQITANAPVMLEHLCDECAGHFAQLKRCLDVMNVAYDVNPMIVRGLDYYTKTVFEIISEKIGAQGTVCGGGRYDGLIAQLGGSEVPGVGFGLGLERLIMVMETQGVLPSRPDACDVYIANIGEGALERAFTLAYELRAAGIKAEFEHMQRSVKAQFKYADKLGSRFVLALGEDEIKSGLVKLRDMRSGEEQSVALDDLNKYLLKVLHSLGE